MSYNLADLQNMCDFFEIKKDTPILLHSSIFTLGTLDNVPIDNTAEVILDFFLNNFKNFNQPTFNYSFPKSKYIDLTLANSQVGILSNLMISKGYYRSSHPMFSFVGNNNSFIKDDYIEFNPFGENSFFDRLTKANGKIIILGYKPYVATYIIYAEFMAQIRYRFLKPFVGKVKTKHKTIEGSFFHFALPLNEDYNHNYCDFHKHLRELGIEKEFKIGKYKAFCFDAKIFSAKLKDYIKEDKFRLLNKAPKNFYVYKNNKEVIE